MHYQVKLKFCFVFLGHPFAECDVSVSKLLGFEEEKKCLVVSDSVSKKIGIEKSVGFGIEKIWCRKKFWIWFQSGFRYFG